MHRLIATVFPGPFQTFASWKMTAGLIILPWVMAMTSATLTVLGIGSRSFQSTVTGGCSLVPNAPRGLLPASTVILAHVPMALMAASYIVILVKTCQSMRQSPGNRTLRRRLEISRTLFLTFVLQAATIYPPVVVMQWLPGELFTQVKVHLAIIWWVDSFAVINGPVRDYSSQTTFLTLANGYELHIWWSRDHARCTTLSVHTNHVILKS